LFNRIVVFSVFLFQPLFAQQFLLGANGGIGTTFSGNSNNVSFGAGGEYRFTNSRFGMRLSTHYVAGDFDISNGALSIYTYTLSGARIAAVYYFDKGKLVSYVGAGLGMSNIDIAPNSGIVYSPGFGPTSSAEAPSKAAEYFALAGFRYSKNRNLWLFAELSCHAIRFTYHLKTVDPGPVYSYSGARGNVGIGMFTIGFLISF
jgi:hypothetical protein